jgi:hypothetical protein
MNMLRVSHILTTSSFFMANDPFSGINTCMQFFMSLSIPYLQNPYNVEWLPRGGRVLFSVLFSGKVSIDTEIIKRGVVQSIICANTRHFS